MNGAAGSGPRPITVVCRSCVLLLTMPDKPFDRLLVVRVSSNASSGWLRFDAQKVVDASPSLGWSLGRSRDFMRKWVRRNRCRAERMDTWTDDIVPKNLTPRP
jgi:hypothetical protein